VIRIAVSQQAQIAHGYSIYAPPLQLFGNYYWDVFVKEEANPGQRSVGQLVYSEFRISID
jgi:hypothetical protein